MAKLKLSELPIDTVIAKEESYITYTVGEVIDEIVRLGEDHSNGNWYTCLDYSWEPDAEYMVERYIENEYDDMYESWDERAFDCFKEEDYAAIQEILDRVFKRNNSVMNFYKYDKEVEIDIFPTEKF